MPSTTYGPISDRAVQKATGNNWAEWVTLIDRKGGETMTHRAIARDIVGQALRRAQGYFTGLPRGSVEWWAQAVTVGYEYAKGRRVPGQTAATGFEVGVTRTLPVKPKRAWEALTTALLPIWLDTAPGLQLVPGTRYTTASGTTGEIRTIKPGQRVRLTWRPTGWKRHSTLQLTVTPRRSTRGTCISFHQEHLPDVQAREAMRRHWREVLTRLASLLT